MPFKNKEARKVYYEKNKEAIAARKKSYYEKNKEAYAAYRKNYYEKNKEAIAASGKAYREKNKEAIEAYRKVYYEKNKEAIAAYKKDYQEKNKESIAAYRKAYDVLRKYGITLAEKKKMKDEQENKCKICYQNFSSDVEPHVDHCHTTGEIRGLLCRQCNVGLGSFKDNPVALVRAAEYLKEQGEEDVR